MSGDTNTALSKAQLFARLARGSDQGCLNIHILASQ
jgi:hypothetical protein